MSSPTLPRIILGTHTIGDVSKNPGIVHFDTQEQISELLDAFYNRGYRELDTARNYPYSEDRLGKVGASSRFTIHTKVLDGLNGNHEADNLQASIDSSLADLKTSKVETLYLHVPDRGTPFVDIARKMDEIQRSTKYHSFGLSNFTAGEVQQFLDICEQHGFNKPSAYQGHYNALVRGAEEELLPILRKNDIKFVAYSPAAAGFFSEKPSKTARWSQDNPIGQLYSTLYGNPVLKDAVQKIQSLARTHGLTGHAVAVRWTVHHSIIDRSKGDAVIFSVSSMGQLHSTLDAIEAGKLPDDLAMAMDGIYKKLHGKGPAYHL